MADTFYGMVPWLELPLLLIVLLLPLPLSHCYSDMMTPKDEGTPEIIPLFYFYFYLYFSEWRLLFASL